MCVGGFFARKHAGPPAGSRDDIGSLTKLGGQILHLLISVITVAEEGALGQRLHPVLVPEELQQLGVERGLEVGDFHGVIPAGVSTEVLGLGKGHALATGTGVIGRGSGGSGRFGGFVAIGEGPEGTDLNTAGADGAVGVYDDGDEGIVELLLQLLGIDINAT